MRHEAKVVWLNVPARGLQFINTYRLNDNVPEDVKFLRPLWENLCTRGTAVLRPLTARQRQILSNTGPDRRNSPAAGQVFLNI